MTVRTGAEGTTDETLMLALRDGDDAALGVLMGRWELPVKAFLLRLGVASEQVEDIAQDSFVRLYEKRQHYRPGAPFKPWFLTVAGNLGRNAIRWRARHPGATSADMAETGEPRADPARQAMLQDEGARVRAAIQALPLPLREAVLCVDLEGLRHAEAAAVMRCSAKAVERRLHRAHSQLRTALAHVFPKP